MRKALFWIFAFLLLLIQLSLLTISPAVIIGVIITAIGLYQIKKPRGSQKKAFFSRPAVKIAGGFILSFIIAVTLVEPLDEEVAKENEVKSEQKDVEQKAKAEEEAKALAEQKEKEEATAKAAAEKNAKEEQAKKDAAKKAEEEKQAKVNDLGLVEATVSRIIDGDTIELSDGSKVRLVGVNTPESTNRTEEYGKEASNYTSSILEGKKVWLQKDVSDADRYNRLLRIVWLDIPPMI